MGDLMTGSSSYKLLAAQYGNFVVPALKIKVNGIDTIKTMGLIIKEIMIVLAMESAGSVVFKIAGIYDEKSHSFQSSIKAKFKLGTVVEVEIGYLSSTQSVFKGYVAMLGAEFGETPVLTVTLMDARKLMMSSGKKQMLHNVKNYSDAVKTVLGSYTQLCTPNIDATSDSLEKPVSQTTNDYDFIMQELIHQGRTDREFFIVGGKAYFRIPQKVKTPALTLKFGRELQDLKVDFSYLDLKIEAIGYNFKDQVSVKYSESVKGFLNQNKMFSQTPVFTAVAPDADSLDKTKVRVQSLVRAQKSKNCIGHGSTIGLPEIVPGRYLKVEALESMVDNLYYITEVTHVMSGENYITYFDIGGVK